MKYLRRNYKSMIMPTLFLSVVGIIVYVLPLLFKFDYYFTNIFTTNLVWFLIYLIISAIFITVYEFSKIKTSRGSDMYYSLPLTKRKLHLQIYLKGLIELTVSYTIIYILGVLITLLRGYDFNFLFYIPLYFIGIIAYISYYSFNSVIFLRANRLTDGIIFIILYTITPIVISAAIFALTRGLLFFHTPIVPIYELFLWGARALINVSIYLEINQILPNVILWLVINFSVSILGFLYTKDIKAENVNQVSDSWIGYRTLIPITLTSIIIMSNLRLRNINSYSSLLIYMLIAYIAYVVYERTFNIKLYQYFVIAGSAIVGLTLVAIFL